MAFPVAFLQGMPKSALHLHLEGSLEPGLAFKIAVRNGIVPGSEAFPWKTEAELTAAYDFEDLGAFLKVYYAASQALQKEEDFEDMAAAYCERAIVNNIRYAEIFFDPQSHTERGVAFRTVADGLNKAFGRYREKGVDVAVIMSILRCHPVGAESEVATADEVLTGTVTAWQTVHQTVHYNNTTAYPKFIGIGLDSNEVGFPPVLFKGVYAHAREHGMHATAHACEEGPPAYCWEAINDLQVVRVDHGVRCIEDPELMAYLAAERSEPGMLKAYHEPHKMPLTMCPCSNFKLKVFPDPTKHTILRFLDANVQATVNSDDPAYFGGYATDNYQRLTEWLSAGDRPITLQDLHTLCRNGFEATWLPLARKAELLKEVDAYFQVGPDGCPKPLA